MNCIFKNYLNLHYYLLMRIVFFNWNWKYIPLDWTYFSKVFQRWITPYIIRKPWQTMFIDIPVEFFWCYWFQSTFPKILILNNFYQDLSNGALYFSRAQRIIHLDKLIVWYCILGNQNSDHNPNENQNFDQFFQSSYSPIWLKSFTLLWCGSLKVVFNNFVITQLQKKNAYEFWLVEREKVNQFF